MSKKKGFEERLEELEGLVASLERGEVSLDEALKLYERGVKAYRACREELERVEKRIEVLLEGENGRLEAGPLDPENHGEDRQ